MKGGDEKICRKLSVVTRDKVCGAVGCEKR